MGKQFHDNAKAWLEQEYPGSVVVCSNEGKGSISAFVVLDPSEPNVRTARDLQVTTYTNRATGARSQGSD